jgi:NAD(P)H-dependent flavin oxidoreductase YrpB (nitropropane dioxygenase family)
MMRRTSGYRVCGRPAVTSGFKFGSVDEAKVALRRGGQGLVVQGSEAGGHNRAAAAIFSLLPAVIDAVPSVPVVAAGGIAERRSRRISKKVDL